MTPSGWAAVALSSAALLFTVYSFWWMYWRPGELVLSTIRFAAIGKGTEDPSSEKNVIFVGLPLIFSNLGARPIVLEHLRLRPRFEGWADESDGTPELMLEGEDENLSIPRGEFRRDYFALPFVLAPKGTRRGNFVFHARVDGFKFRRALYRYQLQYQASGSPQWKALTEVVFDFRETSDFDLHNLNEYYRPYTYPYQSPGT